MRIVHLSGAAVPSSSAASIQAMNMCAAFAELGHDVELIAAPGREAAADFRFYGLAPAFAIRRIDRGNVMLHAIRSSSSFRTADLIYARDRFGALIALRSKKPIVYEAHVLPEGARLLVERWLLSSPRTIRLVVHSYALAEAYRETFARLPPILVAPNGARAESDAPLPDLPPGFRVGYVGSGLPGRGLEVVDALRARMSGVDFYAVGRDRIASPHEAEGWRRAMDVLLLPYQLATRTRAGFDSTRWMSPLKLFEAMAAGKAIVASDLPAIREVLDESNAILVGPSDLVAWEIAIDRLRAPSLRARLGEAARRAFMTKYTWRHRAQLVLGGLDGHPSPNDARAQCASSSRWW